MRELGVQKLAGAAQGHRGDGGPADLRVAGHADLHLGDHRAAQGCRAATPLLGLRGREHRVAGHPATRGRAVPLAAAVARVRQGPAGRPVPDRVRDRHRRARASDRGEPARSSSRPSWPACPRIFEKIYQGANAKAKEGGAAKARIFDWAFDTAAGSRPPSGRASRPGRWPARRSRWPTSWCCRKIRELTGGRIRTSSPDPRRSTARWPAGSTQPACPSSRATA